MSEKRDGKDEDQSDKKHDLEKICGWKCQKENKGGCYIVML